VSEPRRVHYIDWLRVLAVLLLFPFHVSRVFNAGDPFYVKSPYVSSALTALLAFISEWHMPLLFLLAGASSYFALRKRTINAYTTERVKRLLVPFVFGLFVLIPPQTWIGGRFNSGYTGSFLHYLTSTDFLVFNIRDGGDYYGGFGIGQLWFVLWLFMISMVALPLLAWGRSERGTAALGRFARLLAKPQGWLLAAFIILVGEVLPDPVGIPPFYYLAFFMLGYAIMFDASVIQIAERIRWPALITGLAVAAWFALTWQWRESFPDPSAQRAAISIVASLGRWLTLLGMLGLGKRYLDKPGPALAYLAPASYPLYIIHQTVIVLAAYFIVDLALPGSVQWLLLFVVTVAGTFAVYEAVRRVPWIRKGFGLR